MSFTMNVISDHWSGQIDDDYSTGYGIQRVFLCQITNSGGLSAYAIHEAVLGYAGLPTKGSTHPSDSNLFCYHKSARPQPDGKTWKATCLYARQIKQIVPSSTATPQYEFSQSLVAVQTNKDISGTLLTVGYTGNFQGKSFTTASSSADVVNDTITATTTVMRPQQIITCTRLESTNPTSLQDTYGGYVNSDSFTIAGTTYGVKTILCRGITGRSTDGGNSYWITYVFEKKSAGWLQTEFCWNYQGAIPSDVTISGSNGIAKYDLYPTAPMNGLLL